MINESMIKYDDYVIIYDIDDLKKLIDVVIITHKNNKYKLF